MFGLFRLNGTVRPDASVDLDDTLRTKSALERLGYYERPDWGLTPWVDSRMMEGIRGFQRDHDLRIDGVIEPDGETARALDDRLRRPAPLPMPDPPGALDEREPPETDGFEFEIDGNVLRPRPRPSQPSKPKRDRHDFGPHLLGSPSGDKAGAPSAPAPSAGPTRRPSTGPKLPNLLLPPPSGGPAKSPGSAGATPGERLDGETQVAWVAPVVQGIAQGAARVAPHVVREFPKLAPLLGLGAEVARQQAESTKRSPSHRTEPVAPMPPNPGFEPPERLEPSREEIRPADVPAISTTIFPDPGERKAILETFPKDDPLAEWIILENSRGKPETQEDNDILIKLYDKELKKLARPYEHVGGGHDPEHGRYRRERFLPSKDGIRAARPDGSFVVGEDGPDQEYLDFNTADTLKDRRTPVAHERRARDRIEQLKTLHGEAGDTRTYRKSHGRDRNEWTQEMKNLVEKYFRDRYGER